MIYALYIVLAYLLFSSIVLFRNRLSFRKLGNGLRNPQQNPLVSVCIPARNEEGVIRRCVDSVVTQTYKNIEVFVLNDSSTDRTASIVQEIIKKSGNIKLSLIDGKPRPTGWLGKPWACEQLSKKATGNILVFIDADTWLEPNALSNMVQKFETENLDALTVWPHQQLLSFWEKVVVPQVYYALFTLLPTMYVRRDPRWMPSFLSPYFRESFVAGCGQFLAFKRECYTRIGGHQTVKNQIVEDVELAKAVKKNGFRFDMFHGNDNVCCRMYTCHTEIVSGFRKNFLAGFNNNILFFVASALLHLMVFVAPVFFLVLGIISADAVVVAFSLWALLIVFAQNIVLYTWNRWNPAFGLLHVLGVLWFQRLGIMVLKDRILGRKAIWKGREIN
jgi:chlorobactene glucosyltransferase